MVMQTPKFDVAVSSFLNHLTIERGLSSNTVQAYRRDLFKFSQFLKGKPVEEIDSEVIAAFQIELKKTGLSPNSINRMDSTLRSYFKYLNTEFHVLNPTTDMQGSRVARRLPKALSVQTIMSIINAAYRESDPISLRDQCMIELLYSSGARVSELIGINLNDLSVVSTDDGEITTLKLRGKGSKERIVPLGKFATKAIDDYLVRLRPTLSAKNSKTNAALFLNAQGGRISRQSAWNIVITATKDAGVTERVSPHVFRHSYATHLLDGGADIRVVQELLGHASVTTTQIYTLITIDKVRESYAMAHPRARG